MHHKSKPIGINERLAQYRPPIIKADGVTDSERYLAKLAEKSFLNLWSYPNPYRDQKQSGQGDGKELCDLLVVCDQHIIIFSEKTITWPNGDLNIAWSRWAKRAIRDAAKQTKGAERWITQYPDRIFLDKDCTTPFPIDLPPPENRTIHHVVVAKGAAKACKEHIPNSSGSLIIKPSIKADAHWNNNSTEIDPFAIGDVDPSGSFVHIMNDVYLDIIMKELDTIRDFTDYLEKKAAFIRSGNLSVAYGEENLLAYYAIRLNDEGYHDFVQENEDAIVEIKHTHYESFINDLRYVAKNQADKISYVWDGLIEIFTSRMLDGTSITLEGHDFELRINELGARYMALQPRFIRRALGEAFSDALERSRTHDRFFRVVMAPAYGNENDTAFFLMTFKYTDLMENIGGYEHYRVKRSENAQVYAMGILERHPHIKRVVGISCEPPGQGRGSSQELVYVEQTSWTDDERRTILHNCKIFDVLQNKMKAIPLSGQEFPDIDTLITKSDEKSRNGYVMNRKQRRIKKAELRRRK